MGEGLKVQVAVCSICGNNVKIAVTETSFDRSTTREFAKLMEKGFVIKQTTIEEARTVQMYCNDHPECPIKTNKK